MRTTIENTRSTAGTATVPELLHRAKDAIASSDKSFDDGKDQLRIAAEAIAELRLQSVTQQEIADDINKSKAWVCALLKWRKNGYPDTAFGPASKASRARKKHRSGATKHKNNEESDAERKRAQAAKDEAAKAKADAKKAKADADRAKAEAKKAAADAAKAKADAEAWKARAKAGAGQFGQGGKNSSTKPVPERDRDLLVKTLGMLGSDQDGECLNAAHKAEEQRKKLGLTWGDLIVPAQLSYAQAA